MEEDISSWCVGALMLVLAMVGIVLAAHARDDEMYVFGLSLAGLAFAFIVNLLRKTFDEPVLLPMADDAGVRRAEHV